MPIETQPDSTRTMRIAGAIGMLAVAFIHLLDTPGKLTETPYLGFMYIGLIIASTATAIALYTNFRTRSAWIAAGILAASTFIGYCLSRTTGLPQATEDIGNWTEPLGLASLIVEASVVMVALGQLVPKKREPHFELAFRQESEA